MIKRCFALALSLITTSPVMAEETWTDLGFYLFAIDIEGETQVRNVTTDVDVGFEPTTWEGFVGYRRLEREYDAAGAG
jgi:hypothetical protein